MVVVDPGMDVDDKHEVQLDAGVELNCEYSSRVGSVGELTLELDAGVELNCEYSTRVGSVGELTLE